MNRYMYVRGNPVKYIDPTGHWSLNLGLIQIAGGDDAGGGFRLSVGIKGVYELAQVHTGWDDGFYIEADAQLIVHYSAQVYLTKQEVGVGVNIDLLGMQMIGLNFGWHEDTGMYIDAYASPFYGVYADAGGSYQITYKGYNFNGGEFGEQNGLIHNYSYGNYVGQKLNGGTPINEVDELGQEHDSWVPDDFNRTINRAGWVMGSRAGRLLRYERRRFNPRERKALRSLHMLKAASIICFWWWFTDDKDYFEEQTSGL